MMQGRPGWWQTRDFHVVVVPCGKSAKWWSSVDYPFGIYGFRLPWSSMGRMLWWETSFMRYCDARSMRTLSLPHSVTLNRLNFFRFCEPLFLWVLKIISSCWNLLFSFFHYYKIRWLCKMCQHLIHPLGSPIPSLPYPQLHRPHPTPSHLSANSSQLAKCKLGINVTTDTICIINNKRLNYKVPQGPKCLNLIFPMHPWAQTVHSPQFFLRDRRCRLLSLTGSHFGLLMQVKRYKMPITVEAVALIA